MCSGKFIAKKRPAQKNAAGRVRGRDASPEPRKKLAYAPEEEPAGTGLPAALKERFEKLTGLSYDDVVVHYQSDQPEKLGALAYTQGTDVFIGPGNEETLPHELVHVAQQKQGLVKPTACLQGKPLNDRPELELAAERGRVVQHSRMPDHQPDGPMPVQLCRTPTFFTYMFTPSRNQFAVNQGPHTLPHIFYKRLVRRNSVERLKSLIPPPAEMGKIIASEKVEFDAQDMEKRFPEASHEELEDMRWDYYRRISRYLKDYDEAYLQLMMSKGKKAKTIALRLLNMHPYATYAWRGKLPSRRESAGHGEKALKHTLDQHGTATPSTWKKYIDMGDEDRVPHTFTDRDAFRDFLRQMIGDGVKTTAQLDKLTSDISGKI